MKFYNREKELKILQNIQKQSTGSACFTVMIGRRRVGKTALLLKAVKNQKYLYLFVSRRNEHLLCRQFQQEAMEALDLQIFGSITEFRHLFEQLLIYSKKEHFTLIIDEFQDFERVNPAIFSDIQHLWDKHKNDARVNLIICGSIYSMMMKIFENKKEPLFGRATSKIRLHPFSVNVLKEILSDHNPDYTSEDLLCLYLITGGVAKYITLLMEAGAVSQKLMLDRVTHPDSPFLGEGKELLVSEFGKEYSNYFSILQLIASGKTTQSEIDSIIEKNTGTYLVNLEKEYSLIRRNKPVFAKPQSRNTRWMIRDNYLRFWFRFIFPNQSLIEMEKYDLLREYIENHYKLYSGLLLEKYYREKIAEDERTTLIGNHWDRKGENEIDLVALNDMDKKAIIAEVKRNPQRINRTLLKTKARTIEKNLAGYEVEYRGLSMEDM